MAEPSIPGVAAPGIGLLAAAANVVMELAWPAVGHGVMESRVTSGQLFRHPLKRTRTTLSYVAVALLGDDADRAAYAAGVDRSHAGVHSRPGDPVAYDAFDPDLQRWVAACLYVGVEDVVRRSAGALTAAETAAVYDRGRPLATTLQVDDGAWPADREAFEGYWRTGTARIAIDDDVRAYLDAVVTLRFLPWPLTLLGPLNRWVTTGFLPPPFRSAMHYRWGADDERRFETAMALVFGVERHLPGWLRRFPFNVLLADVRRRVRAGRSPV